jgi:hypothetical protein
MDAVAVGCRLLTSKRAITTIAKIDNTSSTIWVFEFKSTERSFSVINLDLKLAYPAQYPGRRIRQGLAEAGIDR